MRNGDDDQTVYVEYLISNKLRKKGGLVSAGGKRIQVTPPGSGRFLLAGLLWLSPIAHLNFIRVQK